jgi:hypothetical protein
MANEGQIAAEVEDVPTELKQEASETTALAEGGEDVAVETEPATQGTRPQRQLLGGTIDCIYAMLTRRKQAPALLDRPQLPSEPTL